MDLVDRIGGLLVGTAVGDALGLPREGLSARRARRLLGEPDRHRLLFGRGMVSDDTEHSIFVAQSLIHAGGDVAAFERRLAWALRWWLLSLPAGVGLATLRAILRSWVVSTPSGAAVDSAGNGPAMRAAPIGAFLCDRPELIDDFVRASTRLTHSDPRAEVGARAVAMLAALAVRSDATVGPEPDELLDGLSRANLGCAEWSAIVGRMATAISDELPVDELARTVCGRDFVTGYVYQTVPVAIYGWFRHPGRFAHAVRSVVACGGDTDTTGAIVGALAGASVGLSGLPADWVRGIVDWPRGVGLCEQVAERLADVARSGRAGRPVRYAWPAVMPRNLLFLSVVLAHGLRRLLPPY